MHFAANPFKTFQNWWRDSVGLCFLDKKVCLSIVLFLRVWKHSLPYCRNWGSWISKMLIWENLSMIIFLPFLPNEMYCKHITFLAAAFPSWLPVNAGTRGFCSSTFLVISETDIECRANTATSNNCCQFPIVRRFFRSLLPKLIQSWHRRIGSIVFSRSQRHVNDYELDAKEENSIATVN